MKYLLFFFLLTNTLYSQNKINQHNLYSDFAKKPNRDQYKLELKNRIENVFSTELNKNNEEIWQDLFSEVGLLLLKSDNIYKAIEKASDYVHKGSLSFQKSLAEIIITLYPNDFTKTIDYFYLTTKDPTLFSYCVHYYLISGSKSRDQLLNQTKEKFNITNSGWKNIPQINYLIYYLGDDEIKIPPIKDILANKFIEGKTIIYSFQRKDRTFPGITIIKKPNGEFVKNENDSIFYVEQLALSVTNLPGYLSQGNTPQGIFSVVGFYNSPTPSIGPTAAVLTRIPYEVPTKLWYHSTVNNGWNIEDYKNLLPDSWKEFLPIYESYYAGKTGRRKIVMHGSVDDLSFYEELPYAPLTPSKGCLTTTEIWSEKNGKNIESNQVKLMNAFFSTGQIKGFLIVIDIDDKKEPVSMKEILPFIE